MEHSEVDLELLKFIENNPSHARVRGFFRVAIADEEKGIIGDSGYNENQITNLGFSNITKLLGGIAGSSAITHLALGSGTVPGAAATTLDGEVEKRAAVTAATSGSTALQLTATFASANSFVTNTQNISNIGCFATSAGTSPLLAGNTYASSSCATNQAVNTTYTWTFS